MASDRQQHLDLLNALARALNACNQAGTDGQRPIGRITVNPIDLHAAPDAWQYCHNIDLTEDGLLVALQQLGADLTNVMPIDQDSLDRRKAGLLGWMDAQTGEAIESGEWTADRLSGTHPELAAELTDLFGDLDPRTVQATVLDHRQADFAHVIEAIDDVFGDMADPLADEDDD